MTPLGRLGKARAHLPRWNKGVALLEAPVRCERIGVLFFLPCGKDKKEDPARGLRGARKRPRVAQAGWTKCARIYPFHNS